MLFEIDPRGLADAADRAAPVDLVDVGLENLVFLQRGFQTHGNGDFQQLAVELARDVAAFLTGLELENIGCELLRDGRCTLAFAFQILQHGAADADGVKGPV